MSVPPSNAAKLPLPQWAYVPGETAEAEADHDTLWQAMALVPSRFQDFVPARHPALRYGIALNDAGYFWESQEILEAVWAAAPQGGRERILLRACIQIANANLRLRMHKPLAAARFFGEALGELDMLLPQCDGGRRRIRRCFSDGQTRGTPEGQTDAADAKQGGLGGVRQDRPGMKKNAYLGSTALDLDQNMHYCAC
jgi:Domain of unknown function (DUF309)